MPPRPPPPGRLPCPLLTATSDAHADFPFLPWLSADKKVFPTIDVVGWYSSGSELQDEDMQIHKLVLAHSPPPHPPPLFPPTHP